MASSRVSVHQLNLAVVWDNRNNVVIIPSMIRQTISCICQADYGKKSSLALHPTAGRSLMEHLCKHKTSSSALCGLQRNVSSKQALNQLCLALGGTLCWSYVGLSLIAHDRVATSKFKSSGLKSFIVSHIAKWNHCKTTLEQHLVSIIQQRVLLNTDMHKIHMRYTDAHTFIITQ